MENYYSSATMEAINSQDNECFHIIETSLDWLELYNGDTLITEGDSEHIHQRLRQIARENGTLLDDVPEDDYPFYIGPDDTRAKFRKGTKVFWNDPDDGLCSKNGVIREIDYVTGEVILEDDTGCLISELTPTE